MARKITPYLFKKANEEEYLNKAIETANWLDTLSVDTENGKFWSRSPKLKDDELTYYPYYSPKGLYSGSAGVGEFYIRLYEITRKPEYLEEAKKAAEYIIATNEGSKFYERFRENVGQGLDAFPGWGFGVYNGPAGEGLFINSLYKYVQDPRYVEFIKSVADTIIEVSYEAKGGLRLSAEGDVSSDGGLILYLIKAYEVTQNIAYIDTAKKIADSISSETYDGAFGGKYLLPIKLSAEGFKAGGIVDSDEGEYHLPNFAHGTSGLGYVFAALYKATKEEKYLQLAKDIAAYIEGISVGDEDAALVPYLDNTVTGPVEERYYLSTCHGPAGSSIVFKELYEITGDEKYLEQVKRFARGTVEAGVPEKHSWGYWPSYSLCCGAPGVLEYFVEVYELTHEEEFLQYAIRTANVLAGDAYNIGNGLTRWVNAWTRSAQDDVDTYIGLYMGAAGCAISLLRLYATQKGIDVTPIFEYAF